MAFWFLLDDNRLARERREMDALQANEKWLLGTDWGIEEAKLVICADIEAQGNIYQVKLTYPEFFPATPPYVSPTDPDLRWSDHQYTNGILCLEWGPDNWNPEVSGAQMLESTYLLLNTENPLGSNEHGTVPTRHYLTPGQLTRNKALRIHMTAPVLTYIASIDVTKIGLATVRYVAESSAIIYHVAKINDFINNSLPKPFEDNCVERLWLVYRTAATSEAIRGLITPDELINLIGQIDGTDLTPAQKTEDEETTGLILITSEGIPHCYYLTKEKLINITVILDTSYEQRTPAHYHALRGISVAIVGLGSIGSKVAETLCRMGVEKFLLIDEDILLLGNLERHSLDWRSIGLHKTDAVANKLKHISPSVDARTININLTGQESNASVQGTLGKIGTCDVMIDATANPKVFNLLAFVSAFNVKPLLWAEVYAGGIGGLIARSRPGRDPKAQTMRRAYHQFTTDTPEMANVSSQPYTVEDGEGQVHIASDADVSIIAHHLARLVADSITGQESSLFPYSMYLIGLSEGWIFNQPFDTRPIQTDHLIHDEVPEQRDEQGENDNYDFLMGLIEAIK